MVGSVILIAAMGALGLIAANKLNQQVEQLDDLTYALNVLSKEIAYGHTRLPQALQISAQGLKSAVGEVFLRAGNAISHDELTPRQAFLSSLQAIKKWEVKEAEPVLLRLADELGASNISQQERFLKLAEEEIRALRQRAQEKACSQGKVYRWGGFLMGGILTLLLI